MCNCRAEIVKLENFTSKTGELAEKVELDLAITITKGQLNVITKTDAKVDYPSKKRPVVIPVLHTYCPWCGEKYEKEDGKAT